jgi:chemotaxis protein CheZ
MSAAADDLALRALPRAEVEGGVANGVGEQLAELRRFIDRRFAELSAEIHAGVSITEMTEATLAAQIGRVQQEVARMVATPVADTRTSGLELEAVVQATEIAANQILEAAEAIQEWSSKPGTPEAAAEIGREVQAIFEACSFQDLTSQRIRRAIRHLQEVDQMLTTIAAPDQAPPPLPSPSGPGGSGADLAQAAIDALLD